MNEYDIDLENDKLDDLRMNYNEIHYIGLDRCINADEYFESLKDYSPYFEPKDKSKSLAKKDMNLTSLSIMKLKSKAIFDEKSKKELNAINKKLSLLEDKYHKEHLKNVEFMRNRFYISQNEYNEEINARKKSYLEKNPKVVTEVFEEILRSDDFTLNLVEKYRINTSCYEYDPENSILKYIYRIPSVNEICYVHSVSMNNKTGKIKKNLYTLKERKSLYIQIVKKILLRSFAVVFRADTGNVVDNIEVIGVINGLNSISGESQKRVVTCKVSKKQIFGLEGIDVRDINEMFSQFEFVISSNIYADSFFEVKEII